MPKGIYKRPEHWTNSGSFQKGRIAPNKLEREIRFCLSCGVAFEAIKERDRKYCSQTCSCREAMKFSPVSKPRKVGVQCSICGKIYYIASSAIVRRRTCSKECQRELIRAQNLERWKDVKYAEKILKQFHKMGCRIFRDDLGFCVRSPYEANFCRLLQFLGIVFEYESERCRFKLSSGKWYICDFFLPEYDLYIEMKPGRKMDLSKPNLLLQDRPELNLWYIDQKKYRAFEEEYSDNIANWEPIRRTKNASI